jgi:hypothetical protein
MIRKHTLKYDPSVTEALASLPALYETDGTKGDRPAVKLFDIGSEAFWVVWEYDKDQDLAFGLCDLGLGFPELGYVSVAELRGLGFRIERDAYVSTLSEGYESRGLTPPGFLMREEAS